MENTVNLRRFLVVEVVHAWRSLVEPRHQIGILVL